MEPGPSAAPLRDQETRAVLWDMDGTLIDSAEYHWLTWRDTLAGQGHTLTHEQFASWFGQRNDTILRRCFGDGITPEEIARLGETKEAAYRDMVRARGIEPLPGVRRWLTRLRDSRLAPGGGLVGAAGQHRSHHRGARAGGLLRRLGFRRRSGPRKACARRLPACSREARRSTGPIRSWSRMRPPAWRPGGVAACGPSASPPWAAPSRPTSSSSRSRTCTTTRSSGWWRTTGDRTGRRSVAQREAPRCSKRPPIGASPRSRGPWGSRHPFS